MREENIWESLMTIFKKMVSPMTSLLPIYLSRIEKLKESIVLLWVLFGLSWLNKNFQIYYK